MNVHSAPSLARAGALVVALAGVSACAPGSSVPPAVSQQAGAAPILLSCPAGQQPLLRQVLVNGAPVSQVECVAAGAAVPGAAAAALTPAPMTSVRQGYATIPTPMAPMAASVAPTVPYAVPAAEDRGGLTAPRVGVDEVLARLDRGEHIAFVDAWREAGGPLEPRMPAR